MLHVDGIQSGFGWLDGVEGWALLMGREWLATHDGQQYVYWQFIATTRASSYGIIIDVRV